MTPHTHYKCDDCKMLLEIDGDVEYHECRESGSVQCMPCYEAMLKDEMAFAMGSYVRAPTPEEHEVRCMLCGDHSHGTKGHPGFY